jgi:pantothenate kinase-related protein Tda10
MEDQEPGKAIPFVNVNVDGFFEVSNEAMSLVESWNKEKKLAIICIAGPYRSGKSYLANRIYIRTLDSTLEALQWLALREFGCGTNLFT